MSLTTDDAAGESQAAMAETCAPALKNEDPRFTFQKDMLQSIAMATFWQAQAISAMTPDDVTVLSKEMRTLYRDIVTLADTLHGRLMPGGTDYFSSTHNSVWYEAYKAWRKTEEEAAAKPN